MRTRSLALLAGALALTLSSAQAQTAFEHIHGGALRDVTFVDSNRGWIVGDGTRIKFTLDGGMTWDPVVVASIGSTPEIWHPLRAVLVRETGVLNNVEGWAAGEGGIVLKTTDPDGQTWADTGARILDKRAELGDPSPTGMPALLYDIFMIDQDEGWAVGEDGTMVKTVNGWLSWSREEDLLPFGEYEFQEDPDDLYDIHFFEEGGLYEHGIIAGEYGQVYVTTDGGVTWTGFDLDSGLCPVTTIVGGGASSGT